MIAGALAWVVLVCVLLESTVAVRPLKEKGLGIEHSPLLDQVCPLTQFDL